MYWKERSGGRSTRAASLGRKEPPPASVRGAADAVQRNTGYRT